ncbi:Hypothetical predicted protein [Mytilus galloprovincialis]|uniref:WSC domain-containing protein n=1 Tax=Mytilus galloprovincialis TaxID=29158 RepID=A0A8B6DJ29_MYTGA|nr:Hypothetical predicted protein [Mytilus galloprovincialis]
MDSTMFCSFVVYWWFNECLGEIYFSDTEGVRSYDKAVAYCDQLPGRLLPYGKEVVQAAKNEGMSGSAWVGTPWFKYIGCFNFNASRSKFIDIKTPNVSSFICASYCRDDQYSYMSMTITHCYCLKTHNETINKQAHGQCTQTCPGNKAENCGNSDKVILHKRGISAAENATIRTIENTSDTDNEDWNGFAIGVGVGVGVIVIFIVGIVVCVFCKSRHKKTVAVKQTKSENSCTGDATAVNAYEKPWSEQEVIKPLVSEDISIDDNIYDHASHKVHRENNDCMVYDKANAGNDVYNITAFSKQHVDLECQLIQSLDHQLDDYDTCASVEMKTK